MGLLDVLGLGKQAGDAVASPIEAVGNVLDKLFTSDDERAQAAVVMEKLRQHPGELQVELNKVEAAHSSVFVAGWRPAIGWVCAASLATYFIPKHIMAATLWVKACWVAQSLVAYPIGIDGLMELVYAMLGLGLYRTAEKFAGKTK